MTIIIILVATAVVLALGSWKFPAVRRLLGAAAGTALHTILVRVILLIAVITAIALLADFA